MYVLCSSNCLESPKQSLFCCNIQYIHLDTNFVNFSQTKHNLERNICNKYCKAQLKVRKTEKTHSNRQKVIFIFYLTYLLNMHLYLNFSHRLFLYLIAGGKKLLRHSSSPVAGI